MRILALMAVCILLLGACATASPLSDSSTLSASREETGPAGTASSTGDGLRPAEEMRGIWLSFLELDPLLNGATPAQAATRLDNILDDCAARGYTTLFFHVRSHGDAYYASSVYPAAAAAAALLKQGFDPLGYTVEAAHQRGLNIHAWINPYRLNGNTTADSFQKENVWYDNPGAPAARGRVLDGIREILQNYAVDGIHFDDYFYPAGMAAGGESFENIPAGTDPLRWRQTQVDTLVSSAYSLCKQAGRMFGVSPMGDIDKCTTEACADVARWLREPGYVDYLCPQMYFGFKHATHDFNKLLSQWFALPRREGVALYGGLTLHKAGQTDSYAGSGSLEWVEHSDIVARQVQALREKNAGGFILFRYGYLTETAALNEVNNLQIVL